MQPAPSVHQPADQPGVGPVDFSKVYLSKGYFLKYKCQSVCFEMQAALSVHQPADQPGVVGTVDFSKGFFSSKVYLLEKMIFFFTSIFVKSLTFKK